VTRGKEKDGKFTVFGDDYSYSRLNERKIPAGSVDSIFAIDYALKGKNSFVGMKLRGWWMQSTSKDDVPDPNFGKKKDQQLPKVRPQQKRGANKQNPNNKRRGGNINEVWDDEEEGSVPTDLLKHHSRRTKPSPYQGVEISSTTEPREPKEKKGATVPASRRKRSTDNTPATIDRDLQPFTGAIDYEAKTVAELKELLRAANLKVSGKKEELIARLKANTQ